MTLFVGPLVTVSPTDYHPPGVTGDTFARGVSNSSLSELQDALSTNGISDTSNIRQPPDSQVTYIGLNSSERTAFIAAGAGQAPSDGKCRGQAFDRGSSTSWEPL